MELSTNKHTWGILGAPLFILVPRFSRWPISQIHLCVVFLGGYGFKIGVPNNTIRSLVLSLVGSVECATRLLEPLHSSGGALPTFTKRGCHDDLLRVWNQCSVREGIPTRGGDVGKHSAKNSTVFVLGLVPVFWTSLMFWWSYTEEAPDLQTAEMDHMGCLHIGRGQVVAAWKRVYLFREMQRLLLPDSGFLSNFVQGMPWPNIS